MGYRTSHTRNLLHVQQIAQTVNFLAILFGLGQKLTQLLVLFTQAGKRLGIGCCITHCIASCARRSTKTRTYA